MTQPSTSSRFIPKTRNRLLATTVSAGLIGAVVGGLAVTLPPTSAQADPVKIDAPQVVNFADVVEAVSPAVVSVQVEGRVRPVADNGRRGFDRRGPFGFDAFPEDHPFRRFFEENRPDRRGDRGPRQPRRGMSQGSGFFISDDGLIVTNNHVVEGGQKFTIVMHDGEQLSAELVGTDPRTDLAVLKVEDEREFTYVEFADDQSRVGEWVVAVGNPFGLGGTVTAGIVSATGREIGAGPYDDFLQIDAAVNRGNSGGPAFNLSGEVVGVNTAIFSPSGGNVGIAFAISAETANLVVSDLIDDGKIVRGWLGVQIQPVSADIAESVGLADEGGAMVTDLQSDSPALDAGLMPGDIVISVDGNKVDDPKHLARLIGGNKPDQVVKLKVWRDGEEQMIDVTLGTLKAQRQASAETPKAEPGEPMEMPKLGLTLIPADEIEPGTEGVAVVNVEPGSAAAEKGLRQGDIILEVGQEKVASADDITAILDNAGDNGRKSVLVQVKRADNLRFLALPVAG